MNWALLIFVVVVALFIYRGYKKGMLRSLSRILSLLGGYIVSILFTAPVSALLATWFQLQGLVAFIAAAMLLFVSAYLAVSLVFSLIERRSSAAENPSSASSLGGAGVGFVVGVVVAFVMVWSFAFLRDIRSAPTDTLETAVENRIENLANHAASSLVGGAMSLGSVNPEVANLSAAIIQMPAEVSQHAQRLTKSEDLNQLLIKPENQAVLTRGNVGALQSLPDFQRLVKNPDFVALAKSAGMITEAADSSAAYEADVARQMIDIWGRTQQVKNDQRVQEIINDPEFLQKIQSGNPLDLLTNTQLLELADIVFSSSAATTNADDKVTDNASTDKPGQEQSKRESKIYSWTDEKGQVHFGNVEPGE